MDFSKMKICMNYVEIAIVQIICIEYNYIELQKMKIKLYQNVLY